MKTRKLGLDPEALSVESFATAREEAGTRGTVEAREADCTYFVSCLCRTAYYYCGDGYHTIYSCNYTNDERCTG